jgi:hypothetical protein
LPLRLASFSVDQFLGSTSPQDPYEAVIKKSMHNQVSCGVLPAKC